MVIRTHWKVIGTLCLSGLLLGCSASKAPETKPVSTAAPRAPLTLLEQQEQLASTIAGITYLKNYCNRSDLGGEKEIYNAVVGLAQKKGWDVSRLNQSQLTDRGTSLYGVLVNSRNVSQNCAALNQSLSPVIYRMYTQNG